MKSVNLSNLQVYKNKISEHVNKIVEDNFCDESSVNSLFGPNNQVITFDGYGTNDEYGYRMVSNIRLYDSDGNLYKISKTGPVYYETDYIQHFVLTRNKTDMYTSYDWSRSTKQQFENYECKGGELKIKISSNYVDFIRMFIDGLSTNYSTFNGYDINAKRDFTCTLILTGYSIIKKFGFNNFGRSNMSAENKGFRSIKLTNTINDKLKGTVEKSLPNERVAYTIDI